MRALLLTTFLMTACAPANAQTLAQEWLGPGVFSVDVMVPFFEYDNVEFPSAGFVTARLPLASVALVADLPYATVNRRTITGSVHSRGIGNVMLGVEAKRGDVSWFGSFRLPTAPTNEEAFALLEPFGDIHRSEAFTRAQPSLKGGTNYRSSRDKVVNLDVGGALLVLLSDDDAGLADNEVLFDYGFLLVHRSREWGVTGGLSGRALVTQSEPNFDERSVHEARLTVDYTSRRIRPSLAAIIPLDDALNNMVPWVLRLGLQVAFR